MEKIDRMIELLGEDNAKRIKDSIADFIIEAMKDDINDEYRENYILKPEDIISFVDKCKEEAFAIVKDEVVKTMVEKIKQNI